MPRHDLEVHVCLIADGPFGAGAGSGLDQGTHALRMLTVDLWDSVARVADGHAPDAQDQSVLRQAALGLRGEAEAIEFVETEAAGAEPQNADMGLDALVDLLWRAVTQLGAREMLDGDPVKGLGLFADALEGIAGGNKGLAQNWDAVVERVSRLAEQTAGDTDERVTI